MYLDNKTITITTKYCDLTSICELENIICRLFMLFYYLPRAMITLLLFYLPGAVITFMLFYLPVAMITLSLI